MLWEKCLEADFLQWLVFSAYHSHLNQKILKFCAMLLCLLFFPSSICASFWPFHLSIHVGIASLALDEGWTNLVAFLFHFTYQVVSYPFACFPHFPFSFCFSLSRNLDHRGSKFEDLSPWKFDIRNAYIGTNLHAHLLDNYLCCSFYYLFSMNHLLGASVHFTGFGLQKLPWWSRLLIPHYN